MLRETEEKDYVSFYSTLVRLKVLSVLRVVLSVVVFLFHIGTIKKLIFTSCVCTAYLFLFHIGTIKRIDLSTPSSSKSSVSIPHWYD